MRKDQKDFTVAFPTRYVSFRTNKFKDRGQLARAVQQGRVVLVDVVWTTPRRQYLNLGLVERIL